MRAALMICPNCGEGLKPPVRPEERLLSCPRCLSGIPDPGTAARLRLSQLLRGDLRGLSFVLIAVLLWGATFVCGGGRVEPLLLLVL
ncbi:MAG: hypothetical protein L0Z62_50695, partial [Gemmataceae bacterium]|nr:hypothetical protein [Gemmataceae bacterium]